MQAANRRYIESFLIPRLLKTEHSAGSDSEANGSSRIAKQLGLSFVGSASLELESSSISWTGPMEAARLMFDGEFDGGRLDLEDRVFCEWTFQSLLLCGMSDGASDFFCSLLERKEFANVCITLLSLDMQHRLIDWWRDLYVQRKTALVERIMLVVLQRMSLTVQREMSDGLLDILDEAHSSQPSLTCLRIRQLFVQDTQSQI